MASATVSANDLQEALRRLIRQWESARQVWNDSVSREFHEQYLEPLHVQTCAAQREMEKMAQVIQSARKSIK